MFLSTNGLKVCLMRRNWQNKASSWQLAFDGGTKLVKNFVPFGKSHCDMCHALSPSKLALPSKLRTFMEFCVRDANPTAHWKYLHEDWGGGVAHVAHKAAGIETASGV